MHDPPPSVFLSWPAPNFVDPQTKGLGLTIITLFFIVLVLVVVTLRFWTRLRITGSAGVDDVLIGFAIIPAVCNAIVVLLADRAFGWNRHVWDATGPEFRTRLKLELAATTLFGAASQLTKASILFFYIRLLAGPRHKILRRFIICVMVFFAITFVIFLIQLFTICKPLSAYWDFFPPNWHPDYPFKCRGIPHFLFLGSVLNTTQDFFMILLSVPVVWKLELTLHQKLAVLSSFSLGFVVCGAGIVKTYFVVTSLVRSYDATWTGWPLWIASAVEIKVGILCASAPALRPFFAKYAPYLGTQTWQFRSSRNGGISRIRSPTPGTDAEGWTTTSAYSFSKNSIISSSTTAKAPSVTFKQPTTTSDNQPYSPTIVNDHMRTSSLFSVKNTNHICSSPVENVEFTISPTRLTNSHHGRSRSFSPTTDCIQPSHPLDDVNRASSLNRAQQSIDHARSLSPTKGTALSPALTKDVNPTFSPSSLLDPTRSRSRSFSPPKPKYRHHTTKDSVSSLRCPTDALCRIQEFPSTEYIESREMDILAI